MAKITTEAQARKAYDRVKALNRKRNPTAEDRREFWGLSKLLSDYVRKRLKEQKPVFKGFKPLR